MLHKTSQYMYYIMICIEQHNQCNISLWQFMHFSTLEFNKNFHLRNQYCKVCNYKCCLRNHSSLIVGSDRWRSRILQVALCFSGNRNIGWPPPPPPQQSVATKSNYGQNWMSYILTQKDTWAYNHFNTIKVTVFPSKLYV